MSQVPPPQDRQGHWPPASSPQPIPPIYAPAPTGDATGGLIPYKNVPALVGYYVGVFALIPCIGIPLGIAAIVLGILGLRKAQRQPEVKGKVHAWIAIVLGSLAAAGYTAALAWVAVAA